MESRTHLQRQIKVANVDNDQKVGLGREIVAGAIGVGILLISLVMVSRTYNFVSQAFPKDAQQLFQDAYVRQKEMVQLALGLLGTVTGYYLGRIPAENAAKRANKEAAQAKQKSGDIAQAAQNVAEKARTIVDRNRQAASSTLSRRDEVATDGPAEEELRAAIQNLQAELIK